MSVIVTISIKGDAAALEAHAAAHPDQMAAMSEGAQSQGAIAHRFYATDDGDLMVVDEWPSFESFQSFFGGAQAEIGALMQTAGATGEPVIQQWRRLDTRDNFGWSD